MQGELKQLSTALFRFGSELFFYLRNMLFSARSLAALPVSDSSVWPCPRCFSSRGAPQRYVGQAGRRRFHRRRREREGEMKRKGGRDGARAKARTRTLLPKLEGRVGLPTRSLTRPSVRLSIPTFLPTFPCPYCPWRSSNHFYVVARRRSVRSPRCPPPFPLVEASLWKERRLSN